MIHTIQRPAWSGFAAAIALALTLSAESPNVLAQAAKATPLPPGVTACDFGALANDQTPEGLNIRAEPNANSAILGRLPIIENAYKEKIAADMHVIGVTKGWFLIENAEYGDYDLPPKIPTVYSGRGWVSGKLLTTQLHYFDLKAAPNLNAATVGTVATENPTAILDCKGNWLLVEALRLPPDATPASKDIVRGWTYGVCVYQRTTCGG